MAEVMHELIPAGLRAKNLIPGDILLVDRPGFVPGMIKLGQKIRSSLRPWSEFAHVVCMYSHFGRTVEALTRGVCWGHIEDYTHVPYLYVRTGLDNHDQRQAQTFLRVCVGMKYGFEIDAAIALRMLTPGDGLWLGASGHEICSGLAAQMLVKGDMNFVDMNPASVCPAELARKLGVPQDWKAGQG